MQELPNVPDAGALTLDIFDTASVYSNYVNDMLPDDHFILGTPTINSGIQLHGIPDASSSFLENNDLFGNNVLQQSNVVADVNLVGKYVFLCFYLVYVYTYFPVAYSVTPIELMPIIPAVSLTNPKRTPLPLLCMKALQRTIPG